VLMFDQWNLLANFRFPVPGSWTLTRFVRPLPTSAVNVQFVTQSR